MNRHPELQAAEGRGPAGSRNSVLSSTHRTLLIGSGGVLAIALILEGIITAPHDSFAGIPPDHHVPGTVHALAMIAILFSLWPALKSIWRGVRARQLDWQVAIVFVVVITLAMGQPMAAGVIAFLFSLGALVVRQMKGRVT